MSNNDELEHGVGSYLRRQEMHYYCHEYFMSGRLTDLLYDCEGA